MSKRACRTDKNQTEIVAAFRKCGARVHITSALGGGFPDLVVAVGDHLKLVELKDGSKSPSARKLTPKESDFFDLWHDHMEIVLSVEEAIDLVFRLRHHSE